MAWWDRLKDPAKGVPYFGGALEAAWDMLPVDNAVRSVEEFGKGNWAGGLGNLGYGALETAALFVPGAGSVALKGASGAGKLGIKAGLKAIIPAAKAGTKAYGTRLAAAPAKTLATSALKFARPDKGSFVLGSINNYLGPKSTTSAKTLAAGLPRTTASAANFRMIEEKQRIAARDKNAAKMGLSGVSKNLFEQSAKTKGPKLPTGKITKVPGTPTAPVAPVAPVPTAPVETPAPADLDSQLAPLTTEQEEQLATQNRQLEAEYARLAAAFTKQDEEARAAEQQARGLAQNIAAGESQNLRTQLASIGMDESPGPAIVGQESIAAQSKAQQAAARGSLSQLLAQIEADKAKAEAAKLLGQTDLEKVRNQLRIGNSLANLQSMYEQFGEL
jgi:hypothetical protein